MRYNLSYKESKINAFKKLSEYSEKGLIIDISLIKKTRSNLQNRALHLYFIMLAGEFLNIGYDFNYTNPFTNEIISIPYTGDLVKEYIWRPLQNQMFKIESTTKLTTEMINLILEVISNWLAEKEICVNFPNKFDLLIKQLNEHEKNQNFI
ncbi:MAG: hypothetical protein OEV44_00065 [Spirochaetota bacterium]|nr:hypothetical protein [Spirochaetota bacterium]